MGKRNPPYTIGKLVYKLEKDNISLLNRLPSIKSLTFSEDMDGLLRLHIGTVCGIVPVCATITGKTKPKVLYESGKVFKSYYDPKKEEEWSKVTLSEPFSYVKGGGEEWKEKMKALVSYLFLQGGYTKQFIDVNGGEGVKMLAAALKTMPDRKAERKDSMEPEKCSKDQNVEDHVSTEEISAISSTSMDDSLADKTLVDGDAMDHISAPSSPKTGVMSRKSTVKKTLSTNTAVTKKTATTKTSAKKASPKKAPPKTSAGLRKAQGNQLDTRETNEAEPNDESQCPVTDIPENKKRTYNEFLDGKNGEYPVCKAQKV